MIESITTWFFFLSLARCRLPASGLGVSVEVVASARLRSWRPLATRPHNQPGRLVDGTGSPVGEGREAQNTSWVSDWKMLDHRKSSSWSADEKKKQLGSEPVRGSRSWYIFLWEVCRCGKLTLLQIQIQMGHHRFLTRNARSKFHRLTLWFNARFFSGSYLCLGSWMFCFLNCQKIANFCANAWRVYVNLEIKLRPNLRTEKVWCFCFSACSLEKIRNFNCLLWSIWQKDSYVTMSALLLCKIIPCWHS